MSLFYYIAANRELPTGSFGQQKTVMRLDDYLTHQNPAAKEQPAMQALLEKYPGKQLFIDIYETEEDAAGLYVSGPLANQAASRLFRCPLVYQVDPEGGSFCISSEIRDRSPAAYATGQKCLTELFAYLDRNMEPGDEVELYSCWAHGRERFPEPRKKEPDLVIELSAFRLGHHFEWKERQYILVKK
jgi:hypothetical protein